jgi:hypothetical protein
MVESKLGMVYGGGSVGLMGVIADEMMRLGGEVIGVIPRKLMDWEVGNEGVTQLHVVETMHERKAMMAKLSDGFVALPGGIGTIEEIVEVFTWLQLGYHQKPCGLLNIDHFFDNFLDFFDKMVKLDFLKIETRQKLFVSHEMNDLIRRFRQTV